MKKTLTSLALIFAALDVSAQTKDTFILKSFPTYDEFGNYYEITKSFECLPTRQDSVNFIKESRVQIHHLVDSVRAYYAPKPIRKKCKKN
jgi:hypothetical protein